MFDVFCKRILGGKSVKTSWLYSFFMEQLILLVIKLFILIGPFRFSVSSLVHFGNLHFPRQLSISFIKFDGINLCINLLASIIVSLIIFNICFFSYFDQS